MTVSDIVGAQKKFVGSLNMYVVLKWQHISLISMSLVISANSSLIVQWYISSSVLLKSALPSMSFYETTLMLNNIIQKANVCYMAIEPSEFLCSLKTKETNKLGIGGIMK